MIRQITGQIFGQIWKCLVSAQTACLFRSFQQFRNIPACQDSAGN